MSTCNECRWWAGQRDKPFFRGGKCKRRAPVAKLEVRLANDGQGEYCDPLWPHTTADDHCGDFERVTEQGERD